MSDGNSQNWLKTPLDLAGKTVWIAGHTGLVGSALMRRLESENCTLLTVSRQDLDLRNQTATQRWAQTHRPDVIIVAAATVGGIAANAARPAEFLYDNLMIAANVIQAAHDTGVEKLLFLGSSCMYPKKAPQPMDEEMLLSGPLEPTNEAYAIAKLAGFKLCQSYRAAYGDNFVTAIPCNLYGPGDRFDKEQSHVIPALIMKAHEAVSSGADELVIWGTGMPLREFLYVDDLADALVFLLKRYDSGRPINVGSGTDVSIHDLAHMIAGIAGFRGRLVFDKSRPDGAPRKLMNVERIIKAGWAPGVDLEEGLARTYRWYSEQLEAGR